MDRPYSLDLRERVVEAAATTSRRQAAARFGVGLATSIRWMAARTTTGTVAARPQGRARRSKLDPQEAFLRARIADKADITLGDGTPSDIVARKEGQYTRPGRPRWSCAVGAAWCGIRPC